MRARELCSWAEELEQSLWEDLADLWVPRCVHPQGGFHQDYDRLWRPVGGEERFLVFQSRVVWACATLAESFPHRREALLPVVRHGLEMLVRMRSTEGGMFRTNTWPDGKPLTAQAELQSTYALAFALFALGAAARVDAQGPALDLALQTHAWIESHVWDEEREGYFELTEADGTPIVRPLGSHVPRRSHNTAMHLFEAFVELARVYPNVEVTSSARRVLDWMVRRLYLPWGTFRAHVDLDNRPIDDEIAYGHDVETAHLLLDAAVFAPSVVEPSSAHMLARRLVEHSLRQGWDRTTGSFWASGTLDAGPKGDGRIWWVQAECLYGLLRAAECLTEIREECLEAARRLWNWIRTRQLDSVHRGWFQVVDSNGQPMDGGIKGQRWKSLYHETRALLYGARALRRMGGGGLLRPSN